MNMPSLLCLALLTLLCLRVASPAYAVETSEAYEKRIRSNYAIANNRRYQCDPGTVKKFEYYALDQRHCTLRCQEIYGDKFVRILDDGLTLTSNPPQMNCNCCVLIDRNECGEPME